MENQINQKVLTTTGLLIQSMCRKHQIVSSFLDLEELVGTQVALTTIHDVMNWDYTREQIIAMGDK
jgi:hypothetical protein